MKRKKQNKVRIINRRKLSNIPNPLWVKTNERCYLDNRGTEQREMTFNPFINPCLNKSVVNSTKCQLSPIKQDLLGHLLYFLTDKDKTSMSETQQDMKNVCLWVYKASCQAGGRRGGTKSSAGAAKLCTAPFYQTQDTPLCLLLTIECIQKRSQCNTAVRSLAGGSETTETAR